MYRVNINRRKLIHPLLLFIQKINNRLGGFSCDLISDCRIPTDKPVIYAITHIGKYDIEVVSEAIKEHYFLLTGEYEHIKGTIYALFLALNGVVYVDQKDKDDRRTAKKKMIAILRQGGNLMYFPEGTWNLSPALPMLPCYWGIIEVARKGDAIIVPVAAEQYGKRFKVNIGRNFDVSNYPATDFGKSQALQDLRDILATLKYEIWESEPLQKRCDITGNEWEHYIEERFSEWQFDGYDLEYVNSLIFKKKIRGTNNG